MQPSWKIIGIVGLVVGIVVGFLLSSSLDCHSQPASTTPATPAPDVSGVPSAVIQIHDTVHAGKTFYDTVRKVEREIDTVYIKAPFWLIDTVRVPAVAKQPASFSLPGVFAAAAPIIAHALPQEPANVLELYAHADHDLLGSTGLAYGAGAEFDLRLDQLHIMPVTVGVDAGYDRGLYLKILARAKFWGAW